MNIKIVEKKVAGEKWRVYTTIDGNRCSPGQRVGYCWSETHRGYLTLPLMKQHECIEKGCKHFQKYEQSPYWQEKEKNKAKKKKREENAKQQEAQEQKILQQIRALTEEDPDFFAISVHKGTGLYQHQYIVRFIKFAWVDLAYYVRLFKQKCDASIYLQEIKNTYEMKMKILEAQKLKRIV